MKHEFITVDELKAWARIDMNEEDALLAILIETASSIVLHHIKKPELIGWDVTKEESMPREVKIATCLIAASLYDDREGGDPLSAAVIAILKPLRDPALA